MWGCLKASLPIRLVRGKPLDLKRSGLCSRARAQLFRALEAGGRVVAPTQEIAKHRLRLPFVADAEGHMIAFLQNL